MRLKIHTIADGQHPSEAIVSFETAEGETQELIVDKRSIEESSLQIGYPVGSRGKNLLIELPGETFSGTSRVWVARESVLEDHAA